MLPQIIEKVIRSFDFDNFGIDGFSDIQDPNTHEWPPELAKEITEAISPEIEAALTNAATLAIKEFSVKLGQALPQILAVLNDPQ